MQGWNMQKAVSAPWREKNHPEFEQVRSAVLRLYGRCQILDSSIPEFLDRNAPLGIVPGTRDTDLAAVLCFDHLGCHGHFTATGTGL